MKKLLLTGMLAGFFISCGGNKEAVAPKTEKKAEKITLKIAMWDAEQQPMVQSIIDEYKKNNPNIDVITEVSPWAQYWTKLETSATGGTLQDIYWINAPQFQRYASNGMILSLDDLVASKTIDPNNYVQSMINTYTFNGKLHAVPKDIDSIALWYNKEIFDKSGLQYPNENWTWNDLEKASETIKEKSNVYGIAFHLPSSQETFWNVIYASGGEVVSADKKNSGYNSPKTVEGVQRIRTLIDKGVAPSIGDLAEVSAVDTFSSGKAGMFFGGVWRVKPFMDNPALKDKINLTTLPTIEKKTSITHGLGWAVYSKTKYPEEAKKFVAFLGSKQANEIQAKMGIIPAFSETQKVWTEAQPTVNLKAYLDIMKTGTPYPATLDFSKWSNPQDQILKKVWNKEIDAKTACDEIYKTAQSVLDEAYKK